MRATYFKRTFTNSRYWTGVTQTLANLRDIFNKMGEAKGSGTQGKMYQIISLKQFWISEQWLCWPCRGYTGKQNANPQVFIVEYATWEDFAAVWQPLAMFPAHITLPVQLPQGTFPWGEG